MRADGQCRFVSNKRYPMTAQCEVLTLTLVGRRCARDAAAQWRANAADGSSARLAVEPARTAPRCASTSRSPATAPGRSRGASWRRRCRRTTSPCSTCAAPAASRSSCSSSWSTRAAPTSGGGAGTTSCPRTAPPRLVLRKASLEFAWGPRQRRRARAIGAVELALASDRGASGTLWIDALRIEARDPPRRSRTSAPCAPPAPPPAMPPSASLEPDAEHRLAPAPGDAQPWLELDLGAHARMGRRGGRFRRRARSPAACSPPTTARAGRRWPRSPAGGGQRALAAHGRRRGRAWRGCEFAPGTAPQVVARRRRAARARRLAGALRHRRRAAARRAARFPRHLLDEQGYWARGRRRRRRRARACSARTARSRSTPSRSRSSRSCGRDGRLVDLGGRRDQRQSLADGHLPIPSVEWHAAASAPAHHGLRRRHAGAQHAGRALRAREPRRAARTRAPVRRRPAVPGQPGLAEPQPGRRRRADHALECEGGAVRVNGARAGRRR